MQGHWRLYRYECCRLCMFFPPINLGWWTPTCSDIHAEEILRYVVDIVLQNKVVPLK
jgi:hypothetical protein